MVLFWSSSCLEITLQTNSTEIWSTLEWRKPLSKYFFLFYSQVKKISHYLGWLWNCKCWALAWFNKKNFNCWQRLLMAALGICYQFQKKCIAACSCCKMLSSLIYLMLRAWTPKLSGTLIFVFLNGNVLVTKKLLFTKCNEKYVYYWIKF